MIMRERIYNEHNDSNTIVINIESVNVTHSQSYCALLLLHVTICQITVDDTETSQLIIWLFFLDFFIYTSLMNRNRREPKGPPSTPQQLERRVHSALNFLVTLYYSRCAHSSVTHFVIPSIEHFYCTHYHCCMSIYVIIYKIWYCGEILK